MRIVQLYHGDVQPWDSHNEIDKNHRNLANECDGPIAALLADLKQRGLFDETLVICGGEFGRTPAVELVNGKPGGGRDHNQRLSEKICLVLLSQAAAAGLWSR